MSEEKSPRQLANAEVQVTCPGNSPPICFGKNQPLVVICGPCVIESRDHALMMAEQLVNITQKLRIPLVYKSSYDKANRTSAGSYRGLGIASGLEILAEVRQTFSVPVISDVHSADEAAQAAPYPDILQIPAFLCRQTDLLRAVGQQQKPVLIKKGQFLHPLDMKFAVNKLLDEGNKQVLLCERGTCFGYRDLVVDFRGLQLMRGLGCPVVFDATHSVQQMGGSGGISSGNREFVPMLARSAVAAGVEAVFLECHQQPDSAPSDGPNMIPVNQLESLLGDLKRLSEIFLETRS